MTREDFIKQAKLLGFTEDTIQAMLNFADAMMEEAPDCFVFDYSRFFEEE